jgi:transposase
MGGYSLDLREKIVESVKKGVSKAETARRFGVDRATVKRYCKQLDERGTLEPRKAPGRTPKLDEKAMKLLLEDLEQRGRGLPTPKEPSSCMRCRRFR